MYLYKIRRPSSGGGKILNVDGQEAGWRVLKLDNFHGLHLCIIPNFLEEIHL